MSGPPRRIGWLLGAGLLWGCHAKTVDPHDVVQSLELAPTTLVLQLSVHPSGILTATPLDGSHQVVAGVTISWHTSNAAIATVSAAGLVTAISAGSATVTAMSGKVSALVTVSVTNPIVAAITVTLSSAVIGIGETSGGNAQVRDSVGGVLLGRPITWGSSNQSVATVSSAGVVTGNALGTVTITAASEGVAGSAELAVAGLRNFTLDNLYLTQAVQRYQGGVPLVIGGNPVLVNIFGTLSRPMAAGSPVPRVRLEVFRGADLVFLDESPLNGTPAATIDPAVPMHRVLLPSPLVQPGLGVRATIIPDAAVPEATLADDRWPRSGQPQPVPVQAVPPLPLHFVPIFLSKGGSTGAISPTTLPDYLYATRQMHPVASIEPTIGQVVSSDVSFGGDAPGWLTLLQLVDLARVFDGVTSYYVGLVRPPPGVTFVQFGGYSYIPTNPQSMGPSTRSSALVALGWFNRARQTTELVAHELAHAMGRMHAPCGGAAAPDPNYPYAAAQIGAFGHDLYSYSLSGLGWPLEYPPFTSDLMSYCVPPWISDYNYEGLLQARGGAVTLRRPEAERDCLIVWGSVAGDSVTLEPAFVVRTRPALPERPGPVRVEGLTANGTVLFGLSFEAARIDHAPNIRHFTFAVPLDERERAALTRIRVGSGGRGADLVDRRVRLSSGLGAAPVALEQSAPDAVTLRWSPADFPAVLLRDPVSGRLLGVGRSGALTLRTTRSDIDVLLSDGVHSATRRLTTRPGGLK